MPKSGHYVGIATGGAVIAGIAARTYAAKWSIVKDGKLNSHTPLGDWVLIDDVVTTGNSLLEAMCLIETPPREIFVVVDRRKDKSKLNISSLFSV